MKLEDSFSAKTLIFGFFNFARNNQKIGVMSMFNRPLLFSEVEKVVKTYLLNPQLNKPLLIIGASGLGKTAAINNVLKDLGMNDFPQISVGSSIRVPNNRWENISEFINEKLELFKNRDNRDVAAESGNHFIIESGLAVLRFEND